MTQKHPLSLFRFCPRCGSARFEENDARSKRCADCGFTLYHNASAATVAVILNPRGEILVARRANEPARGTLDLPGGFVDAGESVEAGCLREVKEETGGEAEIVRFLFSLPNTYLFSGFEVHTADSFFLVRLKGNWREVRANDDAAALMWIPLSRINPDEFGLLSIRKGVERLMKGNLLK